MDKQISKEWASHARELLDLVRAFDGHAIMSPDTPHFRECAKVVAFKFVEAVRSFRAIIWLCESGDTHNAMILGRNMFENLVDVAYLVTNPVDIWRYLEEAAEIESKISQMREKYGPPKEHRWYSPPRRVSPEELRRKYGEMANKYSRVKSWRKLSLRTRAEGTKDRDFLALYEMIYPVASNYAHGGSTVLLDYLRSHGSSENEFHVNYKPRDTEVGSTWALASMCFLHFIGFLDALFVNANLKQKLQELEQQQITLGLKTLAPVFPELQNEDYGNASVVFP